MSDDDPDVEHPLKLRGVPAYAVCSIVNVKGRTMGRGDAEIVIDESRYLTMPDASKDALLDHEIEHIDVQIGKKGRVKLDCLRRPKIKMKLHDHDFGWFTVIAKRHGAASIECKQASQLYLEGEQTLFAFVNEAKMAQSVKRFSSSLGDDSSLEISSGGKVVRIDGKGARAIK